jgi:hypothetical protein
MGFKTDLYGNSGTPIFLKPTDSIGDAFGRLRISEPQTLFDSKQIFDNSPLFYDDQETSGSGTSSVHSTLRASSTMSVSNLTAGTRVRQTFRRFNYQPAKSQLVFFTFVMGASDTGITKRVGYFDENNGIFLEEDGTDHYFVVRSNVTGTPVDSRTLITNGNVDGGFAELLDFTKAQILFVDFEWLGVGSVAFGFVVDRALHYIHFVHNANNLDSVYMSTPNLPIRYEISNDGTGGASSLEHICSSVISEGGQESTGLTRSITREDNPFAASTSDVIYPLMSIRLKNSYLGATVLPLALGAVSTTSSIYELLLILNPTVAGTDAVSWVSVTNSSVEYDISRDNTNTLTSGTILFCGVREQTNQSSSLPVPVENLLNIGSAIDGTRDELVLAFRKYTGAATTVYATMGWRELL